MKTVKETFQDAVLQLEPVYGGTESESMMRILLEDAFSLSNAGSALTFTGTDRLQVFLDRLLKHEPLQYILGQADFYGLKFKVDQRVLIPRQETEELVFWILETIRENAGRPEPTLLDIGTGSGCIPITVKKRCPDWTVSATDVSPGALEVARENAQRHGTEVEFLPADILEEPEWQKFGKYDIIVSNPPYIPVRERHLMPRNVLEFEPGAALFVPDTDPLIFYRCIARFARRHLRPGGWLFYELNEYNAVEVQQLLMEHDFETVILQKDMQGKQRMIRAKTGE